MPLSRHGGQAMKHIDLTEQTVDMSRFLELIQEGPLVVRAPNEKEYMIAEADDFEAEVEQLRKSVAFQQFLDSRTARQKPRRSLAEVAADIDRELGQSTDIQASEASE